MPDNLIQWNSVGASVQGASHLRVNKPNQDAINWFQDESGIPLIMAVADGHGSSKSFRSHMGAKFAVEIAIKSILAFLEPVKVTLDNEQIERSTKEHLIETIVLDWRTNVNEDLDKNPFTQKELDELLKRDGQSSVDIVNSYPLLAYGATLLCVAVTKEYIIYLQIGDGDILCIDSFGETRRKFPKDQRLIAEETTSLCMENAYKEFRIVVEPISNESPSMMLLSTDGYSNSFKTDDGFIKIGEDYLQMVKQSGLDIVARQLPIFLKDASRQGSGDDITLGIIKRLEPLETDTILNLLSTLNLIHEDVNNKIGNIELQKTLEDERLSNQVIHERMRTDFDERQNKQFEYLEELKRIENEQIGLVNERIDEIKSKLVSHEVVVQGLFEKERSLNQSTLKLLKNDFNERHMNLNEQINGLIQKEDEQFTLLNARTNEHDSILMDHNNDLNRIHTSQSECNENLSKMETIVQNLDSDIKNINVVLRKTEEILRKAWLAIIFSLIVAGLGLLLAIIILVR